MLVFKRTRKVKRNVVDFAMLLDNNQYIEYSLPFRQEALTFWVIRRLQALFAKYLIDQNTDVMVNDNLDELHPAHMYLTILCPHVQFKLRVVHTRQLTKRICYYYHTKYTKRVGIDDIWSKLLDNEQCPWITKQIDYVLQKKSPIVQWNMKVLRVGMFYMVIKNHLSNLVHMSMSKNKQDNDAT